MRQQVEQAVELLRSEHPDALERAVALLQNTVYSFSMKVCGHREDAEDNMQDVLVKAVPYLPKFTSSKALSVWLYTVAKNRCLMSRRRSKFAPKENLSLEDLMPEHQELEGLIQSGSSNPEEQVLQGERAELLHEAVLKVPPQYRMPLVLHDMEGLGTEEVARILGLTEVNVRVRLHRARLFVRKELSNRLKRQAHRPSAPTPARQFGRDHKHGSSPISCRRIFAALSDYLDQHVDQSMCAEIEKHIAGCRPCEAFIADLEKTIEQLRGYNGSEPDPTIAEAVRKQIVQLYEAAVRQPSDKPKLTATRSEA